MKKIKMTEKSWAGSLCGCGGIGATAEKDRGKTVTVDTVECWVEWYGPLARWTSLLSFVDVAILAKSLPWRKQLETTTLT